jgi:hypothetical protein
MRSTGNGVQGLDENPGVESDVYIDGMTKIIQKLEKGEHKL